MTDEKALVYTAFYEIWYYLNENISHLPNRYVWVMPYDRFLLAVNSPLAATSTKTTNGGAACWSKEIDLFRRHKGSLWQVMQRRGRYGSMHYLVIRIILDIWLVLNSYWHFDSHPFIMVWQLMTSVKYILWASLVIMVWVGKG